MDIPKLNELHYEAIGHLAQLAKTFQAHAKNLSDYEAFQLSLQLLDMDCTDDTEDDEEACSGCGCHVPRKHCEGKCSGNCTCC